MTHSMYNLHVPSYHIPRPLAKGYFEFYKQIMSYLFCFVDITGYFTNITHLIQITINDSVSHLRQDVTCTHGCKV